MEMEKNSKQSSIRELTSIRELNLDECQQVGGGLIGPDQDLSDFHPIAWPRINVAITSKLATIAKKALPIAG